MDAVTLKITVTGSTVWGTVNAKYTFQQHTTTRSCSAASCRLHIPQGVTLHLSQTPADSATWPFQDWRVKSPQRTRTMSASSIKVKVTGTLSVKAIYVLAQSSSTGGYTP
jgi:hypothetical protein